MKKRMILLLAVMFTMMMSFVAYADEWEEKADGWYYRNDDGTYAKNTVIDGYYISYTGRMINEAHQDLKRGFNIGCQMIMNGTAQYYEKYGIYRFDVPYKTAETYVYENMLPQLYGFGNGNSMGYVNTGYCGMWNKETMKALLDGYVSVFNSNCISVLDLPVVDRYKAICDFVAGYISYTEQYDVYRALQERQGDCVVYSSIYKVLCNMAGLDCDVVINVGDHNWCRVSVNGQLYWIDPQYYDTEGGKGFMIPVGSGSLWDQKYQRAVETNGWRE